MAQIHFRDLVADATSGDRWVVDGNYSVAREIAWRRAEAIVWLDLPFHVVMAQVMTRTLQRCVSRRPLWNGNRTDFRRAFCSRDSIILWAECSRCRVRGARPFIVRRAELRRPHARCARTPGRGSTSPGLSVLLGSRGPGRRRPGERNESSIRS